MSGTDQGRHLWDPYVTKKIADPEQNVYTTRPSYTAAYNFCNVDLDCSALRRKHEHEHDYKDPRTVGGISLVVSSIHMKLSVLASLLTFASAAFASQCRNPLQRREWQVFFSDLNIRTNHAMHRRTLSELERFSYLAAVRCLQAVPAKSKATVPGAISRFDDFAGNHILQTDTVHFVVSPL